MAAFQCPGVWNKACGIHGWGRTLGKRVFICYCGRAVKQGEGKEGKKVAKEEESTMMMMMMMEKKWEENEKAGRFCGAEGECRKGSRRGVIRITRGQLEYKTVRWKCWDGNKADRKMKAKRSVSVEGYLYWKAQDDTVAIWEQATLLWLHAIRHQSSKRSLQTCV